MTTTRRLLLPAVSSLALLLGAGLPAMANAEAAVAAAEATATQAGRPWAHEISDLKPDERLRFGRMPNGMRYVLMRNATPPGLASLRLHFNAGSLNEDDDQKGLAHFTEHMLFNGTQNIPETEMLRILERLGLAFGADTNAGTSFDQTFYVLELPRATDEIVDTSLNIMREQASRALMDPAAINAERDVIVGEERTRNSPGLRALKAQLTMMAPGQRLSDRLPIGDLNIIRTAPAQRFVDFYNAYYRPERATMIAVGDFDLDYMEGKIRNAFQDWLNPHPNGSDVDFGTVKPRGVEAFVHVEPGTQNSIQLVWTSEPDTDLDTRAKRMEDTKRSLAFRVLNRRLGELSRQDNPPFLGAGASEGDFFKSIGTSTITASFNPGGLERALQTIEQEKRRMELFGVTEAEIRREITDVRTALEKAVSDANTQMTNAQAGYLLGVVNEDTVPTAPQTNLELFNETVANLDITEVNRLFAESYKGYGPLAMLTTPTAVPNGEAEILRILEASQKVEVTAPAAKAELAWPYTDFGTPGVPASTSTFNDVEATMVTFPNNVRLVVKPTQFRDDQILIQVVTGIGDQALPRERFSALKMAPTVFTAGGLGKLTLDEMNRVLSGKVYSAGLSVGSENITLSGATRPADLELQMQLLAAYFTDPGLRAAPLEQIKTAYPQIIEQMRSTVGGAFALDGSIIIAGGDRRATQPSLEEVQALTVDTIKSELTQALAQGPIDITVVGNVTLEQATAAVAKTFGAMPIRSALPAPLAGSDQRSLPPVSPTAHQLTHNGQADQAGVRVFFPTTGSSGDRREARLISLMSEVLSLRVLEEIREKQALTYSPGTGAISSSTYPNYGYIVISGDVDPAKIDDFHAAVNKVATSFVDNPVTEDELTRARNPIIERTQRNRANNSYWLGNLADLPRKPEDEALVNNYLPTLQGFTVEEVQATALKYLKPENTIRIETRPAAK